MENRHKVEPVAGEHTVLIHFSAIPPGEGAFTFLDVPAGWTVRGKSMQPRGEYLEYRFELIPPNIRHEPDGGKATPKAL
jgi:hypothetical protein